MVFRIEKSNKFEYLFSTQKIQSKYFVAVKDQEILLL